MAYKVFISHSMDPWDKQFVDELFRILPQYGIEPYVAEYDPQYGESITEKIRTNLDSSDLVLVLYTENGAASQFVNHEIGYAVKGGKKVVVMKDRSVPSNGLIHGIEMIDFDPYNPQEAIYRFVNFALPLKKSKEQWNGIVKAGLIIGGGLLLASLLSGNDEDEDEEDW